MENKENNPRTVLQILVNKKLFDHWINKMNNDKKKTFRFLVSELLSMDIEKPSNAKAAAYLEYIRSFIDS